MTLVEDTVRKMILDIVKGRKMKTKIKKMLAKGKSDPDDPVAPADKELIIYWNVCAKRISL